LPSATSSPEANGNLVVSPPGPSYPTAVGTIAAAPAYNSLDKKDRGLGVGWTLACQDGHEEATYSRESARPPERAGL